MPLTQTDETVATEQRLRSRFNLLGFLVFFTLLILAGVVLAFLSRDWLIKAALEQATTRLTGFKTQVKELHWDLPSTLLVQGLEIRNPPGFHQEIFARIPEVYITLDLPELLRGERFHLPEVRLHLEEIFLEKNEQGISNVSLLSSVGGSKEEKARTAPEAPQTTKKTLPFYLNRLELTIRRVHYEDHAGMMPEKVKGILPGRLIPKGVGEVMPSEIAQKKVSLDMNIEKEVFTDIQDPQAVVNVILAKILYGKTFGNLKHLGVDPDELVGTLNVKNTARDIASSGQELFEQTAGRAAESAKDQIKNLWGKLKRETS